MRCVTASASRVSSSAVASSKRARERRVASCWAAVQGRPVGPGCVPPSSSGPHRQAGAGRQLGHAAIDGARSGQPAEPQKLGQGVTIDLGTKARVRAQRLELGGEKEAACRTASSTAASCPAGRAPASSCRSLRSQAASANMPLARRQHAFEAPGRDRLQQDLGVGMAPERASRASSALRQLGRVVDFAVVADTQRPSALTMGW